MTLQHLHAGQIKAARAMLDWSQEDLAQAAGLALNTVRNLEMGNISPRGTTNNVIRQVIESAGLEFIEGRGVRYRTDDVQLYQGSESCSAFFDNMAHTIRKKGGDITVITRSMTLLAEVCGAEPSEESEQLAALGAIASVKCLLAEAPESSLAVPANFQLKVTPKRNIGPLPCFIYGDKYVVALADFVMAPRFVVFNLPSCAQSQREHFQSLWDDASPLSVQLGSVEKRVKA